YEDEIGGFYNILSTMPDNSTGARKHPDRQVAAGYWRSAGTSMACPHVSGLAALLVSHLGISVESRKIEEIIRSTADDLGEPGPDTLFGSGRINAYKALISTDGLIYLDKRYYNRSCQIKVTVIDRDEHDFVNVTLESTTEVFPENITLTETLPNSGRFEGFARLELDAAPIQNDQQIAARHNDLLTAKYFNKSTGKTEQGTATIDIRPPVIMEPVRVILSRGFNFLNNVDISLEMDEPAFVRLFYGQTLPLDYVYETTDYSKNHQIWLGGLGDREWLFAIEAKDAAGNLLYDDNGGNYYRFRIIPPGIHVSTASLTLEAFEGATEPVVQTFSIDNNAAPGSCDLAFLLSSELDKTVPYYANLIFNFLPKEGHVSTSLSSDIQFSFNPIYAKAGIYTGKIHIRNNVDSQNQIDLPFQFIVHSAPALHFRDHVIKDDGSGRSFSCNGNRRLNPGETVEMFIKLENSAGLSTKGKSARISPLEADPYITVLDDTIDLRQVGVTPGSIIMSSEAFLVKAASDTPDHHTATFKLDVEDVDGRIWTTAIYLESATFIQATGNRHFDRVRSTDGAVADAGEIVCDNNGNVYSVWNDSRGVYFNHSSDHGITWMELPVRIDSGLRGSYQPQITCDDRGNIYVIWEDIRNRTGFNLSSDIYFNCSHDYGATWHNGDIQLDANTDALREMLFCKIKCDNNGTVYALWLDVDESKGVSYICFNHSSDFGLTWQNTVTELQARDPVGGLIVSDLPDIACDDSGNAYVVWNSYHDGIISDIYLKHSNDFGETWQDHNIRLNTSDPLISRAVNPQVICDSKGNVLSIWEDYRNGGYPDLYSNHSYDYGQTWQSQDIRIDKDGAGADISTFFNMAGDDNDNIYVAWMDSRTDYWGADIYLNHSPDYGNTWQVKDIRLETLSEGGLCQSYTPRVACNDKGNVYVVWHKGDEPYFMQRNYNMRGQRFDVFLNYSNDYGNTWLQDYGKSELLFNEERKTDAFFPSYSFTPIACDDVNFYAVWREARLAYAEDWPDYVKIYFGSIILDPTPPTTPVVTDQGRYTTLKDQLACAFSSADPESGIVEYQYKITQDSITRTIIKDWTSAGTYNWVTVTGLTLLDTKTYYFSVKAKNGVGLWSNIGYSDGIQCLYPPTITSISPTL
ncbi:MAG: S8 family serine peptidase, partial [Dehalococcoidales bacterium]|nr:S8 family serine peptidase [Dehalococcoidales bacterium]